MDDNPNECPRSERCATLELWNQLDNAIKNVIDNTTLQDLAERQRLLDSKFTEE
jgi:DNA-binding IscR family transcriptional regulator